MHIYSINLSMPLDQKPALEDLHPSIWRASQLARSSTRCVDTGHAVLRPHLPGGGWPTASLTEVLGVSGVGELRLLKPVFEHAGKRRIAIIQPPYVPNAIALTAMGLRPEQLVWVQPKRAADALWAAEQVLRGGGFSNVLLWQVHARNEALRRLNLAAAEHDGLFFLFRPLSAAQDPSPAPLRISVRAQPGGVQVEFLKRRGPSKEAGVFLPLSPSFIKYHAPLDRAVPTEVAARGLRTQLVE